MSLYDAVGGDAAVNAAVDLFYEKVLADPILIPFFEGVNMDGQSAKQKAFFTTIFKGDTAGADAYMRRAHKGLVDNKGLSDPHFNAVAGHLQATLQELEVPADLITQIMGAAAGLKNAVLNR
ncbi:MAG: group 1 truncated hemoglobin [Alphaproteobacteria bacterium]|nr:group 1 truncated hemoglobin [Alphaproteobacteria bacterium]